MVIPHAETEAALIALAQRGDRQAYGEVVRQHYPGVVTVVYRLCGDGALAQDAAQEAFIRSWNHLSTFKTGSSFRNWLYRIAVNVALDALRRNRRTDPVEIETLSMSDPQPGPEKALLQKERAAAVQMALLKLTETSRAVLVLREYGELSYQEIATALDIPLGTVMSRLSYARKQLKQLLEPYFISTEIEHG